MRNFMVKVKVTVYVERDCIYLFIAFMICIMVHSTMHGAALVHSAVLRLLSSVCPSLTICYRDDIGWNSSKITTAK